MQMSQNIQLKWIKVFTELNIFVICPVSKICLIKVCQKVVVISLHLLEILLADCFTRVSIAK